MKNIIEKIKSLNLPENKYVVIGSGTLAALGIRDANDIDISVTHELLNQLNDVKDWKEKGVDIQAELLNGNYSVSTEELIKSAIIIDGIRFMNLDELIRFKKAMGRDKDLQDIELINTYQKG